MIRDVQPRRRKCTPPYRRITIAVATVSTGLLAACSGSSGSGVDVRPIGSGLEFIGFAIVLSVLIAALSRFIK